MGKHRIERTSVRWLPVLALVLVGSASSAHGESVPRPFVTDGCTAWSEGTPRQPELWRHCCVRHDLAFWAGSAGKRDQADLELRDCVAETGQRGIAKLMYFGIRAGRKSPRKIAGMQWGNAWSPTEPRRTPLSVADIDALEREILDARYDAVLDWDSRRGFIQRLRSETPR